MVDWLSSVAAGGGKIGVGGGPEGAGTTESPLQPEPVPEVGPLISKQKQDYCPDLCLLNFNVHMFLFLAPTIADYYFIPYGCVCNQRLCNANPSSQIQNMHFLSLYTYTTSSIACFFNE